MDPETEMSATKLTILVCMDYYLPGFKGGGPLRAISNLAAHLADDCEFKVLTRDRDLGDTEPYANIKADCWQKIENVDVYYFSPQTLTLFGLRRVIRATKHDVLYMNSFFSPKFTLSPLLLDKLGLISSSRRIIAPRGEFSPGALVQKKLMKDIYLSLVFTLRLHRHISWQVSSEQEAAELRNKVGSMSKSFFIEEVVIAPELSAIKTVSLPRPEPFSKAGTLRLIFLSRISPKKNLHGALLMLEGLKGNVRFDIYGPIEDQSYWDTCMHLVSTLPANVDVQYMGCIPHEQVDEVLSIHDIFFFPTFGENFGYVILEALVAGCPVLLSDQTPWHNLAEMGVGWEHPLANPNLFTRTLQQCIDMDAPTLQSMSLQARAYGLAKLHDQDPINKNRRLFVGGNAFV